MRCSWKQWPRPASPINQNVTSSMILTVPSPFPSHVSPLAVTVSHPLYPSTFAHAWCHRFPPTSMCRTTYYYSYSLIANSPYSGDTLMISQRNWCKRFRMETSMSPPLPRRHNSPSQTRNPPNPRLGRITWPLSEFVSWAKMIPGRRLCYATMEHR